MRWNRQVQTEVNMRGEDELGKLPYISNYHHTAETETIGIQACELVSEARLMAKKTECPREPS